MIAAASTATKIAYPQRFDAAGIRDDLSAMFAVLDDKVRPQMPPAVVREARLGIARGLLPEATADVESEYTAEAAAMYERDAATLAAAPATDAEAAVNAALGALDYRVPAGMDAPPGSVVVVPLGPRQIIGLSASIRKPIDITCTPCACSGTNHWPSLICQTRVAGRSPRLAAKRRPSSPPPVRLSGSSQWRGANWLSTALSASTRASGA